MYSQFITICLIFTLVTSLGAQSDRHESIATGANVSEDAVAPDSSAQSVQPPETRPMLQDIFLVLDNSGSMQQNDPLFLTKQAVTEFIVGLSGDTRVAMTIFDERVHKAFPLTNISQLSTQQLSDSLTEIDYKGQYSNSPMAIESAIYDLKNHARESAGKVIIFMTDGIVDTGNPDRDLEKAEWLTEDLAADAAGAGIRIFGIAFTDQADFELIQSLAQKTQGEYYRVFVADELYDVFGRLNALMNQPLKSDETEQPVDEAGGESPKTTIVPKPIIVPVPVPAQPSSFEILEDKRFILIVVSLIVLVMILIVMAFLIRDNVRSVRFRRPEVPVQEAYLNDIHGITRHPKFTLGGKPTILGRVAGKDSEHINYFVIPEATIGRRHALIEHKNFSYWISDQGSINGTFVNGRPITSETRLKHGDIIRLHTMEFEFVMQDVVDADKTVLSDTAFAKKQRVEAHEVTLLPDYEPAARPDDPVTSDENDPNKTQFL